jgi:acyl-coenzyme A thioesterase PaaI-like protein
MIKLISPRTALRLISYWPPYFFSGVRVIEVNESITSVKVKLTSRFWNKNYIGTHFGGSLYAMTDPFYMFILLHNLKVDHIVWDISAEIQFIKATDKPVTAHFQIDVSEIEKIKAQALQQFKVIAHFSTDIVDSDGTVVAKVRKGLYVRRKDAKTRFTRESREDDKII